ncbi:MAG: phosphate ABC transporter permease subunit PstC [Candidatus Korarchaeota archaeon]|nr:phosphate ABC transporter permease subunit PstC [Candidatus Korarchaeota archaeon]NIU83232.1 phosphate ABC transporter permease subunit PstC [Candidatus Thorarchaeota archaeon]NIW13178.1 phosphate ABC transporter permease subunit PstC [Candidatus Thorarchaeota archaeon]NIW51319.1 phosphate ABC transporter permease subunit PstC [Candidatus Korarchaeota archaeon]
MTNGEKVIRGIFFLCAAFATVMLFLIAVFVFLEGFKGFTHLTFLGRVFFPSNSEYGVLPLLVSSFLIVGGALILSLVLALPTAIFIAEVVPFEVRETLKSIVELLAAIPSVIYGFIGLVFFAPLVADLLHLTAGTVVFTASLILGIMILPTMVSLSTEALLAIPDKYREASLALGASEWQTVSKIILPAAKNGIFASIILAFGRAIGETIAVLLTSGVVGSLPSFPFFNQPAFPLTAAIARFMGETVIGGELYHVLFGLATILFVITFVINTIADHMFTTFSKKYKEE